MAATQAKNAFGTVFRIGDGATPTETFTEIAEVEGISGFDMKLNVSDATHMKSDNGYMESIPTLKSIGEGQVTTNMLLDATQAMLVTAQKARRRCNFQFAIPAFGKRFQGAGYVTNVGQETPKDGTAKNVVTITPTGEWSIVADS